MRKFNNTIVTRRNSIKTSYHDGIANRTNRFVPFGEADTTTLHRVQESVVCFEFGNAFYKFEIYSFWAVAKLCSKIQLKNDV